MPLEIIFDNYFDIQVQQQINNKILKAFDKSGASKLSCSLCFIDDEKMREINYQFRDINATTDVLSFSAQEGENIAGCENILGEILISSNQVSMQAKKYQCSIVESSVILFIHGLMHLFGLDHEKNHFEAVRQVECEMSLLDQIDINPDLALSGRIFNFN